MDSILIAKSFEYSLMIIDVYNHLCNTKHEYVMSKQLLRSSTSIGANVNEGQYAQSKKDLLSKMHISLKEASESSYWIDLLVASAYLDNIQGMKLKSLCTEIIKILTATIKTTKKNLGIID